MWRQPDLRTQKINNPRFRSIKRAKPLATKTKDPNITRIDINHDPELLDAEI